MSQVNSMRSFISGIRRFIHCRYTFIYANRRFGWELVLKGMVSSEARALIKAKRKHHRDSVVYGKAYLRRRGKIRVKLWKKQRGLCNYCGTPLVRRGDKYTQTTIDHIVPRSRGGGHNLENLQLLHAKCHAMKDNPGRSPKSPFTNNELKYALQKAGVIPAEGEPDSKGHIGVLSNATDISVEK